jgi:hypothetical protein
MNDIRPQGAPNPDGHSGHEPIDIKLRGFAAFLVAFAILAVVVHFVLDAMMSRFSRDAERIERARPELLNDEEGQFPSPKNQVAPRADLVQLRERERAVLTSYDWVDKKAGIARIPIDRAISILVERGLPKGRTSPPRGSRTKEQP